MPAPVMCIGSCDGGQGLTQRGIACVMRPRLHGPPGRLDLQSAWRDRRQLRRVGGQIQQTAAPPGYYLLGTYGVVISQGIPPDDVTWDRRGPEAMLPRGANSTGIGRAFPRHH